MPYVVVQLDGAPRPVKDAWRTPPTHVPEAVQDHEWNELCGELVSLAAGKYPPSSVNIFLMFDRTEYLVERDQLALEKLVRRTRERCWGARVFVVLSHAPGVARIDAAERTDVEAWMQEIRAGRVCDVIEVDASSETTPKDQLRNLLKIRAKAVIQRQSLLLESGGNRPWRCALPPNRLETAKVLGPKLATTHSDGLDGFDLVIVVAGKTAADRQALIMRHLGIDPNRRRRYRLVTYDPDLVYELETFCQAHEIGPAVAVKGDFELWYLMLRLNELATKTWREPQFVDPVPLAPKPSLTISNDAARLTILLTSAFDTQQMAQCLAAATDLGQLLHLSPTIDFHVELAVDTNRLLQILKPMPSVVDAWIHLGHGSGKDGLWIPQKGHVRPQLWTDCFRGKELRLAMFLTCHSREIARHFASEGAGVAIGFEGEVESDTTRELATPVLQSMLTGASSAKSILDGFDVGAAAFRAAQQLNARPWAYYSRQT